MAQPTGVLTPTTAADVLTNTSKFLVSAQLLNELVQELISIAESADDSTTTSQNPLAVSAPYGQAEFPQIDASASAWARLYYKCGPSSELRFNQNGRIVLYTLGEVGTNFGPIWGDFENCVIAAGDYTQLLTGTVAFLPGRDIASDAVTFLRLNADLASDDVTRPINFEGSVGVNFVDFLEYADGTTFVVRVPTTTTSEFGVRDSRGAWLCNPSERQCTLSDADLEIAW
ncbi:MAG: hypothetical protein VX589_01090 [Myxococcota bacterium]|nr:hypothetical protein [Myxococcota bacterium]